MHHINPTSPDLLGDDFEQVKLLHSLVNSADEEGFNRVQLRFFQKHGDQEKIAPEGHLNLESLLMEMSELMRMAQKYRALADFAADAKIISGLKS